MKGDYLGFWIRGSPHYEKDNDTAMEPRRCSEETQQPASTNDRGTIASGVISTIAAIAVLACLLAMDARAQTQISVTVDTSFGNIPSGKPIAPDFVGLGFETASELAGNAGVSGYFFTPSNKQLVALFQQMGVKNIRLGGGTGDECATPIPEYSADGAGSPDINNAFEFAQVAGVDVIYTLRMVNRSNCSVSDLPSKDAAYAQFIWNHYRANLSAFALSNETDFHAAHSFCISSSPCACPYPSGCSGSTSDVHIVDPLIFETAVPGSRATAGTAFPAYLADWISFAQAIHDTSKGAPGAPIAGPDSGSYVGGGTNFSGVVPPCSGHDFTSPTGWTQMFAMCESGANGFSLPTQHYYVGGSFSVTAGGNVYALSTQEAIDNMLSPNWVDGDSVTTEPFQPVDVPAANELMFTGYRWLNAAIPPGTRMTELNDYLGGVPGASNGFASALWALDIMHWFALHGAAGVNFHNNQWIPTDTVVPGNLTKLGAGHSFACAMEGTAAACTDFVISPKGYGIKAFNLGGHGYAVNASIVPHSPPSEFSLTGYAVASGQDLYVTIINKTQGTASGDTASVTIVPTGLPFIEASVSSILLWDGVAGDPTKMSATLGGASIVNTGAQWTGIWKAENPDTSGSVTLSVQPSTAEVVRFHAGSNYSGPMQIDQSGALEIFTTDKSGGVFRNWQKSAGLNTEPNSAATKWNGWGENLSRATGIANPTGDLAVAKNLDNTLEIFMSANNATNADVFFNQQQTPGGAWKGWTDMGSSSAGLAHLNTGQNADGGLSVFGLDLRGNLWTAAENAPGVAWSSWTELSGENIRSGYMVGQNLNGRLEIFGVDTNGNVRQISQTLGNTWATSGEKLGAPRNHPLNSKLQIARNVIGDLMIFALDSSGNVWSAAQKTPGGSWGTPATWTELPKSPSAIQPGFVAGENADGRLELFGTDSGGTVYNVWITPDGSWNNRWVSIGGPAGGLDPSLVVGNTNDGRLQVFGVAASEPSDIWSNWQSTPGGGWQRSWADFGGSDLVFYHGQP